MSVFPSFCQSQNLKLGYFYGSIIAKTPQVLPFLCRLRSIAAHRDHFVRRLSVCACVCLSGSHTSPHIGGPCECDRVYTVAYFFVKLGRHVNHDERMHPIDYRGQRSKVKVTMDIYGNKLVNTIET